MWGVMMKEDTCPPSYGAKAVFSLESLSPPIVFRPHTCICFYLDLTLLYFHPFYRNNRWPFGKRYFSLSVLGQVKLCLDIVVHVQLCSGVLVQVHLCSGVHVQTCLGLHVHVGRKTLSSSHPLRHFQTLFWIWIETNSSSRPL